MKISEHIKKSLRACDERDLDAAMLFVCLAIDGTSSKCYPEIKSVGKRFRQFLRDRIDIIELMFGGFDLKNTEFPFKNNKGQVGLKFEDIIYEKYRCSLAHGNEYENGFGIDLKIAEYHQQFNIDIAKGVMTVPESTIFALGLACVLAPENVDQKIGDNRYYYSDGVNNFVADQWWGKQDYARQIMSFDNQIRIKIDFTNVWPKDKTVK